MTDRNRRRLDEPGPEDGVRARTGRHGDPNPSTGRRGDPPTGRDFAGPGGGVSGGFGAGGGDAAAGIGRDVGTSATGRTPADEGGWERGGGTISGDGASDRRPPGPVEIGGAMGGGSTLGDYDDRDRDPLGPFEHDPDEKSGR